MFLISRLLAAGDNKDHPLSPLPPISYLPPLPLCLPPPPPRSHVRPCLSHSNDLISPLTSNCTIISQISFLLISIVFSSNSPSSSSSSSSFLSCPLSLVPPFPSVPPSFCPLPIIASLGLSTSIRMLDILLCRPTLDHL